jgi:hypothetical protein
MQKYGIILIILIVLVSFTGCAKKPSNVATQFMTSIHKLDFDGAKQFATKDSEELLTLLQGFASKMSEEQKTDMLNKKFVITDTKITGDSAIVTYDQFDVQDPDNKESKELKMKKENGEWKVKLEKGNAGK